jgi:2-polyprenyl-3-methyl-5-hydroxy-6-metoxy-1,4-benzoquinol methylase
VDPAKLQAFAERMNGILNGGMLALMTSIGHRTGLFDAMAGLAPSTSEQVARTAGLDPRYVREWLDAMVAGRIVEYEPSDATYSLPAEHASLLTRAAGGNNMAGFADTIPWLAVVEPEVEACFRGGGGVPYDRYDEFLEVWSRLKAFTFEETLLPQVLPLVPDLADVLASGCDVLEIGCGEAHPTHILARAFPESRFTGCDFREDAVAFARDRARATGTANACFQVQDLTRMEDRGAYDAVLAFDVIHDQAQPREVLRRVAQALRAGGLFLMVDIKASSHVHENLVHPLAPFLYGTSLLHCMTVSLALGGEGLGAMWGEQRAYALLAEAGFGQVDVHEIPGDPFNNYYLARRA